MNNYDLIVVGARVSGAATAMLAARAGLDVVVLDRGSYGSDTLSTHALMRGGVVQLHRWGLLPRVAASTPPIRRTAIHYAAESLSVTIKPSHGIGALYAPRRTLLDPVLVDGARAAGASVRYGATVTGLRHDRAGRVCGVEGHDRQGPFAISGRLVVGADGVRSAIARLVDARATHMGTHAGAVVYGYWAGLESDGYEWAFRAASAAGFIPTGDGLTCVFAGGPPERVGRGGPGVLQSIVESASPAMGARLRVAEPASPTRTFTGLPGFLRDACGQGWALVGDAGSWRDPISAHGLTDALRDAELLARAVVAASAEPSAEADLLAAYQAERDRLSRTMLQASDDLASYRWTDDEVARVHRRLSSTMADDLDAIEAFDATPVSA